MIDNIGIIYKVTNLVNNKVYIGKTKEFLGNAKFGYNARFKQHLDYALGNGKHKDDCPLFYNAIRKYGRSEFKVSLLANCKLTKCDDLEIFYIKKFDSTNRDTGYNISSGGGGRSVVHVSEEVRKKISNNSADANNEINIKPYYKDDQIVGYFVKRRERGKQYQKLFASTSNTPEENYTLASEWLDDFKNGKLENNKYNKKSKLPENISYAKKNGKIVGYGVHIMINGTKIVKSVQDKNMTLDELLEKAIKVKESIINASQNIEVV